MSDNSGQNDPSMKEILGSIRRIISEDNAQTGAGAGEEEEILDLTEEVTAEEAEAYRQEPTLAAAGQPDDAGEPETRREPVLGLHGSAEPEAEADQPAPTPGEDLGAAPLEPAVSVDFDQPIPIPTEMMQDPEPHDGDAPADAGPAAEQVIAEEVAAPAVPEETVQKIVSETATSATATALGELTRAMDEKTNKMRVGAGDVTIADMVKELIRPMLREWLDENLPGIVERVVRREIQKLVDRAETED
jgi:cell pole-organizing protein PopZ